MLNILFNEFKRNFYKNSNYFYFYVENFFLIKNIGKFFNKMGVKLIKNVDNYVEKVKK